MNELINKQAVLDFIRKNNDGGWVEVPECDWIEFIENLPTVNSQEILEGEE